MHVKEITDKGLILADGSLLAFPCSETGAIFQFDVEDEFIDDWWPGDEKYDEMLAAFPKNGWSGQPRPSLRVIWPDE